MKSSPKVSEFSPSRLSTADATSGSEWETDDDDDNREKFKPEVSIYKESVNEIDGLKRKFC